MTNKHGEDRPRRAGDYDISVRRSTDEQGGWVCSYPDLPGCFAWAETRDEAISAGAEVAEMWLSRAPIFGITPPAPGQPALSTGVIRLRVAKSTHRRLTLLAKECGMSLNGLVAQLVNRHIDQSFASRAGNRRSGCGSYFPLAPQSKASKLDASEERAYSGTWIQRLQPSAHEIIKSWADAEGVSDNLWMNTILLEELTLLERHIAKHRENPRVVAIHGK